MIPPTEPDVTANQHSVCRESFLAVLDVIETHAIEIQPDEAARHRQEVQRIRSRVQTGSDALSLKTASSELDIELRRYGKRARQVIDEREKDVREIFSILADIAGTISDRTDRYTAYFRRLADELESAEDLNGLGIVRSKLSREAIHLKSGAQSVRQEDQASVERLQDELKLFRQRLAQAEAEAATDPLTGLANRREAERIINIRICSGRPVCIMLFDLNGFKRINDRYGHVVGDQVLKTTARRLTGQFRDDDRVCRWGGDEFLAVLSKILSDPMGRATQVVSRISGSCTVCSAHGAMEIPVGVSVGVAQHQPGETIEELFTKADALLYKRRGMTLATAGSVLERVKSQS